ncbi:hypothetical protein Z043_103433, partial [Scleropages formosus]
MFVVYIFRTIMFASYIIVNEVEGLRLFEHIDARCLSDALRVRISRPFVELNNVTLLVRDRRGKSHVLSPSMSARCGYKQLENYSGGLELWASLTACHMYLQRESRRLRLSVGVKYVPLDLSWSETTDHVYFSCPYKPSSGRKLVCEEAYTEVSHTVDVSLYDTKIASGKSSLIFEIRNQNGTIMTQDRKWISYQGLQLRVDRSVGRITLRVPLSSPIVSIRDSNGFLSVEHTFVVKLQDVFNTEYDLSAQCPVVQLMCQEGDVVVSTANLWLPSLMERVEDYAIRIQLDGVTLSEEDAVSKGYKISLGTQGAKVSFATRNNPLLNGYNEDDSGVNKHRLALVLLWGLKEGLQHSREVIHIPPHSCHPQHQDPVFTVSIVEDGFNVTYGPVPASYSLSATSVDGMLFQRPGDRLGGLQTHTVPGNDSYHVSVFSPFGGKVTPWKYLGGLSSQYTITPVLIFLSPDGEELIMEGAVYRHVREDIVLPGLEGYCQDQSVCFNITQGNAAHLWMLYIWDSPFTNEWRAEQQHSMRDSLKPFQLCISSDAPDLLHKSVSEERRSLVLGVSFRDQISGEVKVSAQHACPFLPAQELTCSAEGVVHARGLRLISSPTAQPELLTLLDPTCKPSEVSRPNVSFIFSVSSCGTVKKVQDNVVEYENKISNVKSLGKFAPEYLKFESTLVCRYRNPGVIALEKTKNAPHAQGNFQLHLEIMKDWTFSTPFRPDEFPVTRLLREPVLVEVGVESSDPQIELYLRDCWASPTPEPTHSHSWFLIKDGCEVDEDEYKTVFHKVELSSRIRFPQHYKHFEMRTFAFVNSNSRELLNHSIYIHCNVVICDLEIVTSDRRCKSQCNVDKQRK